MVYLPVYEICSRFFNPNVFVQLGVGDGTSFFSFYHSDLVESWAIDSWSDNLLDMSVFRHLSHQHPNIFPFRGKHEKICRTFPEGSVDMLHTTGAISENWLSKISKNGVLLIEDYRPNALFEEYYQSHILEEKRLAILSQEKWDFPWHRTWEKVDDFLRDIHLHLVKCG